MNLIVIDQLLHLVLGNYKQLSWLYVLSPQPIGTSSKCTINMSWAQGIPMVVVGSGGWVPPWGAISYPAMHVNVLRVESRDRSVCDLPLHEISYPDASHIQKKPCATLSL